jgi:hypothetical protein
MPVVAGAGGGVGTSVIAAALWAFDNDLYVDGEVVDVLVCKCTVASVTEAQRLVGTAPYPPVLAVVADIPSGVGHPLPPPEVTALTRMAEPHVAAQVGVPFVPQWRSRPDPDGDAGMLLRPGTVIPEWLGGFSAAMTKLIEAIQGPLRAAKVLTPPGRRAA